MRLGLSGLICAALLMPEPVPALAAGTYAPDAFVRDDIVTAPTQGRFSVCHAGACALVTQTALNPGQWARIAEIFKVPSRDAQEERARIAEAIGRFETLVGVLTDTADDRAENRTGNNWRSQMDCVDESTNTTTYLRILSHGGLLRWHRVEARVTRGFFLFGWPHTTAVISETADGARWVVDSWFFDNGVPPVIVPLDLWKTGWRPAHPPQPARNAAIASAHPLATAAGHEILSRGGNAFDAAVAVAAVLAVVEPYSSGLGGGGFWLLHRARDGHQVLVDARETAPAGANRELYLDREGRPVRNATTQGGTAAAIPGTPAALAHIAARYGTLPLATLLERAIHHAREGVEVDERYARAAGTREQLLRERAETSRLFLDGGRAPRPGWKLRQPDLAATLERVAGEGRDGFYGGAVATALVESVKRAGGVWQLSDLANYRPVERAPLKFTYRGAAITTAPLPSAGGIALMQCLQMLEHYEPADRNAAGTAHFIAETLRRAFRDRAHYLGDADLVAVPVDRLTSRAYAAEQAATIQPAIATRSDVQAREPRSGGSTTHISIVDTEGNRVAATLTINLLFGSGVVAEGTGVLLNNEMDDFTIEPEVPNAFRLRGGNANIVAPGKRPLSSMTPTFVEDMKGVLVIGAPGGSRIVSQVLLAVLDYVRAQAVDLAAIVGAPRYHHQWWPDRVEVEPGAFDGAWRAALEARGHRVETAARRWGNMQAVFQPQRGGPASAASDPRGADY